MGKPGGSQRSGSDRSESGRESERGSVPGSARLTSPNWSELGSKRGSERGSKSKRGSERKKDDQDPTLCAIPWDVPLAQFQVDGRVYRPKPVLWGPLMSTPIGLLTLDWQLSVSQHRTEARVSLYHRTRGIPNLGVNYSVFLEGKDGSKGKLTAGLRAALATSATGKTTFLNPLTAQVKRYIHPGNRIRIHAIIRISRTRFHPLVVLDAIIKEERKAGHDYEDGVVGARLWQQVVQGGKTSAKGTEGGPQDADVVFKCPDGEEVFAFRSVMAAFSPRFRASLNSSQRKGRWVIASKEISATALREVLHFIYLRHPSGSLYKANLGEVLEAARLFQQPAPLKLEVEKLLVLVLDPGNAENLWKLAQVYGLNILANMILTSAAAQPGLKQRLIRIRRDLLATRDIPPSDKTQRDSTIVV